MIGGGQKKLCAAKPRKFFLNYTFISKGYDFVHKLICDLHYTLN